GTPKASRGPYICNIIRGWGGGKAPETANPFWSKQFWALTSTIYSDISVLTEVMKLTDIQRQFVLHWGEMGTRWGINRTVAQIHALLYLSPEPLNAEQIAETLNVARSNVSTSIRELESWGIVRPVHVLGDRREHYEALKDVSEMFVRIMEQRKRRELDPTLQLLRRFLAQLDQEPS